MSQPHPAELRLTPLNGRHLSLGARMAPFAGWSMPFEYAGAREEHLAVRTRAGVFDVSPLGQIEIAGAGALDALQWIASSDASRLESGETHHSALTTPEGTFVDDIHTYRFGNQHFLLVVNAINVDKDVAWIAEQTRRFDVAAVNTSARYALIALQGPIAGAVLGRLTNFDLSTVEPGRFQHGEVASVRATVSRAGDTGEDGYEIFAPPRQAGQIWDAILEEGSGEGVCPAGLGARDTLRLEAAMRQYGHEIDEHTTLLEAGLEWMIGWNKSDFLGRAALEQQRARGASRQLVGFEITEDAIAHDGCRAFVGGVEVGRVTSGHRTPHLEKSIGLAYLPTEQGAPGSEFDVDVRGRMVRARVVPLPFYKRPRG